MRYLIFIFASVRWPDFFGLKISQKFYIAIVIFQICRISLGILYLSSLVQLVAVKIHQWTHKPGPHKTFLQWKQENIFRRARMQRIDRVHSTDDDVSDDHALDKADLDGKENKNSL